jgi:hypothetical protein
VAAYVRTVRTASGATAVQIVHSSRRGTRDIEHLGSAHDEEELETLKAAEAQRLALGQGELDLTARRYRTAQIRVGERLLTAEDSNARRPTRCARARPRDRNCAPN